MNIASAWLDKSLSRDSSPKGKKAKTVEEKEEMKLEEGLLMVSWEGISYL